MANISGPELVRLRACEKRLYQLEARAAMEPFVAILLENLGLLCATKPWEKWTETERIAFQEAARKAPAGAALYRENLPKE